MVKGTSSASKSGLNAPPAAKKQRKPHRRSPWACDECRLRKRRCDGAQPCAPCKASNLECDYRFRRPVLAPTQRIRLLEQHLTHAVSFLQELERQLPSDTTIEVKPVLDVLKYWSSEPTTPLNTNGDERPSLSSMLAGCQRLISPAPWSSSFYGASSEVSFILRMLELFDRGAYSPQRSLMPVTQLFNNPMPTIERSPANSATRRTLPDKSLALEVIQSLFTRSHPFVTFLHGAHFRSMVDLLYDEEDAAHAEAYARFLPLLHNVLALGYLLCQKQHRRTGCSTAVKEATKHFSIGYGLLEVSTCDDLVSIQALLCGIVFLISVSRLTSAHALIGLACSSALRLGLHSNSVVDSQLSSDERRMRALVFAALLKVDMYTSLMLDLPRFLQDDLVERSIDNVHTVFDDAKPPDLKREASTKHLELLRFTCNTRQSVFLKTATGDSLEGVDPKQLAEVEKELHRWTRDVSVLVARMGDEEEFTMVKYDLEMACNFAQIVLFRPFLHYLRFMADGKAIPLSQSRHALACIKIASTTILRSQTIMDSLSHTSMSWDAVYTLFLAVMCLVFLISAHNGTSQPSEAWQRGAVGIRILTANKCVDGCASGCLDVLKMVVRQLNHTVDFDFEQIEATTTQICRSDMSAEDLNRLQMAMEPAASSSRTVQKQETQGSAAPEGIPRLTNADKMLAHAEDLPLGFRFTDLLYMDFDEDLDGTSG